MTKRFALAAKAYDYLADDGDKNKKAKGTKNFVLRLEFKVKVYENCLVAN